MKRIEPSDGVGQVGHHVHLLVERRAAGHVQLDAQLVVQDGRERGLAQPRRAVEEDVRQRLAPLPRRRQRDRQPLGDAPLADRPRSSRCGRSFSSSAVGRPRLVRLAPAGPVARRPALP